MTDILRFMLIAPVPPPIGSMAALGHSYPRRKSAVSIFRLILWQMRDPVSDQRTRILVLLNKGTPVKVRDTAARAEVL